MRGELSAAASKSACVNLMHAFHERYLPMRGTRARLGRSSFRVRVRFPGWGVNVKLSQVKSS